MKNCPPNYNGMRMKTISCYMIKCLQFEYLDWLAAEIGIPPLDQHIRDVYREALARAKGHQAFRDEWDVDGWILQLPAVAI